jgi:iron(III) transport system substrate-binding protein
MAANPLSKPVTPRYAACLAILAALAASQCGKSSPKREVVVYVSVDQVNAEPALLEFERRTGIKPRPVFDVEAAKSAGLAARLAAEKTRPQADVFWSGEFVETLRLKREGVLARSSPRRAASPPPNLIDPDGVWYAFGGRLRVILVNRQKMPAGGRPRDWEDFASDRFPASQLAVALPLFGTSADQAAALYASWGADKARAFYRRLKERGVRVVDGNSVVRDLVAQGSVAAGWTDSDDACGAVNRGDPVDIVLPGQQSSGTLLVPGTVAQVAGAPHPEEARRLIEFLLEPSTERMLVENGFFQAPAHAGGAMPACMGTVPPRTMTLGLEQIASHLDASRRDLNAIFGQ